MSITKDRENILNTIEHQELYIGKNSMLELLYLALDSAEDKETALTLTIRGIIENYLEYLLTDIDIKREDSRLFYEDEEIVVPFSNVLLLRLKYQDGKPVLAIEEKCGIWSEENALTYYAEFFCGVKSPERSHRGDVLIMAVLQTWMENRGVMPEKLVQRDVWEFAALLDCVLFKVIMNVQLGSSKDLCLRFVDIQLTNLYRHLEKAESFQCKSGEFLLRYFRANIDAVRDAILACE